MESELERAVRRDERGTETISTVDVQPLLRNAVWEARNRSHLIGLKAGSPAPTGLVGTMRSAVVDGMSVADITGNAHTVERTPAMARQLPIDCVMFTFVLAGESFHYNGSSTVLVKQGEVAAYDSDTPFLLGFSEGMHAVVASVPRYHLADIGMQDAYRSLQVLRHVGSGLEPQASRRLLEVLQGAFDPPAGQNLYEFKETFVGDALQAMRQLSPQGRSSGGDRYFEEAMALIQSHLGDPDLSIATIAQTLHLSQRHLGRIFAGRDTTVGQMIQEQRLAAARDLLTAGDSAHITAAEVALRSGFSSPSHFSRAFRNRYGMTPTQARRLGTRD